MLVDSQNGEVVKFTGHKTSACDQVVKAAVGDFRCSINGIL